MSYRAFKRLLGETSLERKCRFLFGAGIVVLISLSFLLYAYQTEHLAYDQATTTCRLLVKPVVLQQHLPHLHSNKDDAAAKKFQDALGIIEGASARLKRKDYQYHFLVDKQFDDSYERDIYKEFLQGGGREEYSRLKPSEQVVLYYAPIRANTECLACHGPMAKERGQAPLQEDAMLAMVRIRMPTAAIEEGVHWNRAILIATAFGTAVLIMAGSWIIIRYIIVKPVRHLKDVADAISGGELNVRSEIQTGDEFEDLSHAFNRMLRNLVAMQDQYRRINADMDRKVDELAQANLALYESNRLKGDFLATMSHELRTPLNSILGFSDVLSTGEPLNDKQKRWVTNIHTNGQRLLNLINEILDLAKIEAGKMHVRIEEFNLHDVCENLLTMFRPLAEKKNIDLRSLAPATLPSIRQDLTKLQQILQNLLSNAIKFTPEGGRVVLKAEIEQSYVVLTILDTGVGIAEEEQELVFQKFRQSGSPLTREQSGTGLGLSIVRELCKLLGGDVTLVSELGRGSRFTVRLPMELSPEPRLEYDLADEGVDLTKAQRVDARLYAPPASREPKAGLT